MHIDRRHDHHIAAAQLERGSIVEHTKFKRHARVPLAESNSTEAADGRRVAHRDGAEWHHLQGTNPAVWRDLSPPRPDVISVTSPWAC